MRPGRSYKIKNERLAGSLAEEPVMSSGAGPSAALIRDRIERTVTVSTAVAMPQQRIAAVDAARGCAMFLACLSHIKEHFSTESSWYWWIAYPTRLATPTFLLLSGFIIGHLLRTDTRATVRISLLDRGLFLLIVAHLLLGLVDLPQGGVLRWLFGTAFITDAIGIALLVAVVLRAAGAVTLTALGAVMCLGSWWMAMTLTAQHEWTQHLGAVLFDMRNEGRLLTSAPLIPYVGVFLIGMALSLHLKPALLAGAHRAAASRLALLGGAAIVVVALGMLAWHFGNHHLPNALREPDLARRLRATLDLRSKRPPSPAYLMFYGGMALLMLAAFLRCQPRGLLNPVIRITSVVGRASLMCFVVQDWLLLVMPEIFGFSNIASVPFWFAYLAACALLLYALAKWWDGMNGNRFLSVGLKALARRRAPPSSHLPRPHWDRANRIRVRRGGRMPVGGLR